MALTDVFGKAVLRVTADTKGLKDNLKDGEKKTESSMARMAKTVAKADVFKALAASAVAATAVIVTSFVKTTKAFDQLAKDSQRLGIATEQLSAMGLAADFGGASVQAMTKSVIILSRNMNEAAKGTKLQAEAFAAMGVEVSNTDGSLRDSIDVMRDIADRFAEMEDGPLKVALAMDTLGRSGAQLIPLLNGGGDALRQAAKDTELFGTAVNIADAVIAEEFNDNIRRMQEFVKGIAFTIGTELLPVMRDISNAVVEWLRANSGLIRQRIGEVIAELAVFIRDMADGIKLVIPLVVFLGARFGEMARLGIVAWEGLKVTIVAAMQTGVETFGDLLETAERVWFGLERGADVAFAGFQLIAVQAIQKVIETADKLAGGLADLLAPLAPEKAAAIRGALAGIAGGLDLLATESAQKAEEALERTFGASGLLQDVRALQDGLTELGEEQIAASIERLNQLGDAAMSAGDALAGIPGRAAESLGQIDLSATIEGVIGGIDAIGDAFQAARDLGVISAIEAATEIERIEAASAERRKKLEEDVARAKAQAASLAIGLIAQGLGALAQFQDQTNKRGFERAKKIQIGAAIASSIQGAINAYTSTALIPFVGAGLAPIAAAVALAAGLASVKKIQSTKFEGGAGGGGSVAFAGSAAGGLDRVPRDGTFMVHKDEAIIPRAPAEQFRALASSLSAGVTSVPPIPTAVTPGAGDMTASSSLDAGGLAAAIGEIPVRLVVQMEASDNQLGDAILRNMNMRVRDLDGRLASSAVKGLSGGA